jgi:regulator of sigma E protease
MSSILSILGVIAGLGLLMVVHESGHYFAARAFGMRVIKFSIGMPPVLLRHQRKDSPTVFQIGAIPFFAYVQIAGMNPLEEVEPNDKGSYANASLLGRIVTIMAGSLANYLCASVLFFAGLIIGGEMVHTTIVKDVFKGDPADKAGLVVGDKIVEAEGAPVTDWLKFRELVLKRPNVAVPIVVERSGARVPLVVTPVASGKSGEGRIGLGPEAKSSPIPVGRAATLAVKLPARVVGSLLTGLTNWVRGREEVKLGGPVMMMKEGQRAAEGGPGDLLFFLAALSANLALFNLLPFPALDGGRLMFLGYEAVSRRRPDATSEAYVHLFGFVMLLALMVFVTWNDIFGKH